MFIFISIDVRQLRRNIYAEISRGTQLSGVEGLMLSVGIQEEKINSVQPGLALLMEIL